MLETGYIVPISEKGNAISVLYLSWQKLYHCYIILENEGDRTQKDMEQLYHSSIPCLIQVKKDIEQSYHCPISGYITFAESSTTVLYPVGY